LRGALEAVRVELCPALMERAGRNEDIAICPSPPTPTLSPDGERESERQHANDITVARRFAKRLVISSLRITTVNRYPR
jgi:hypothetical protein